MTRLVGAELLKLRTTWGIWAYVLVLVALVAISVAGSIASRPDDVPFTEDEFGSVLEGASAASLLALVLGLVGFTVEFRHGTIPQTFLVTPTRERVLAAKALTYALVGLAFGIAAVALALAVAVPWLRSKGLEASLGSPEVRRLAVGVLAASALFGALGAALGGAIRNQVAAVVGVLLWVLVAENLIGFLLDDVAPYLPAAASRALTGQEFENQLSQGAGALVTAGWTAAALALATILLRRRDIT